jgi:hypothetical protein
MRTLCFARLDEQLRLAPAVSVNLLQQVAEACPRLPPAQQSKQATDIDRECLSFKRSYRSRFELPASGLSKERGQEASALPRCGVPR